MNKLHKQTEQQSQGRVLQQEEKEKKKNKYLIEFQQQDFLNMHRIEK